MKKFLLFTLVATMFAACVADAVEEPSVTIENLAPETLTVSFEGDDSRIQLQEGKTVWTEGDLVSVFYRSNANQKWQYQGKTGERSGNLERVANAEATQELSSVVVVYPYNENYYINPRTCNVKALLPAEQTYLKDSYGLNGNIMISQSEYNQFSLKNVCGWLKVQLKGEGQVVKSITLKGNNGEQVAGEIHINPTDATATLASKMGDANDNGSAGENIASDTILTEVTLDCGEGVELNAEATTFYIALPPQTFSNGFSLEITDINSLTMTKSTEKEIVIKSNHILPMAELEVEIETPTPSAPTIPNNEIWYTATQKVTPYKTDAFGANIVSNTYENGQGVILFDREVTQIGYRAFCYCSGLRNITMPHSVTTIGQEAFMGTGLTSIAIGDNVTKIGKKAFSTCASLESVNIPNSVTEIADYAFEFCSSLKSMTIPDSVIKIGSLMFDRCSSLQRVEIGNGITSLPNRMFLLCSSLVSVTFGDNVIELAGALFEGCDKLQAIYGKYAVDNNRCWIVNGKLVAVIPNLTEYSTPDNITSIGAYAFSYSLSLKKVFISNRVTSIENHAFYNCTSLTDLTTNATLGDYAFCNCSSLTNVTLGNGCTAIGTRVFNYCTSLKSITIPIGVVEIDHYAFSNCSSLTSVTIPNSVISIGVHVFEYCNSLTSITIPDSVSEIPGYTFCGCSSLISVNIPYGVTSIGQFTFSGCSSLISVTIPDRVTEIEVCAFEGCRSLTSVTIPNSVTSIGNSAFYKCTSLTSVTIGNGVTSIGEWAFSGCTSLTSVTIPDSVSTIARYAFSKCSSLTSVTIPDSITNIEDGTFEDCSSLTNVIIGNNVHTIWGWAFRGCTSLINIIIPDSVSDIWTDAFAGCTSLKKVTIGRNVDWCGLTIFRECTGELVIHGEIIKNDYTIDKSPNNSSKHWLHKSKFTKMTIGDNVSSIGDYAFYGYSSLTEIYCQCLTPPILGTESFGGLEYMPPIYVPRETVNAYKTAEGWEEYADYIVGYDF